LSPSRSNSDGALHLWLGPVGAHPFWPDVWKSRPAWCGRWREPLEYHHALRVIHAFSEAHALAGSLCRSGI
jgi:hypothetical protein